MPIWAPAGAPRLRARPAISSSVPAPRDVTTEPADTSIFHRISQPFLRRCGRASLRAPLPSGLRGRPALPAGTGQRALRRAGEHEPLLSASPVTSAFPGLPSRPGELRAAGPEPGLLGPPHPAPEHRGRRRGARAGSLPPGCRNHKPPEYIRIIIIARSPSPTPPSPGFTALEGGGGERSGEAAGGRIDAEPLRRRPGPAPRGRAGRTSAASPRRAQGQGLCFAFEPSVPGNRLCPGRAPLSPPGIPAQPRGRAGLQLAGAGEREPRALCQHPALLRNSQICAFSPPRALSSA